MHNDGSVQLSAAVRFQLEGPIFAQIENWRRAQTKIPSRPDAIRELLRRALCAVEQRGAQTKRNRRSGMTTDDATAT
jgi:hypothetical protein